MIRSTPHRHGFTLIELLVAMSIAILLAALAVGVVYSTGAVGSQRVVAAADKVSGWLMVAKQRAIRDGNVQGVRFFLNGDRCSEAQYIEKPAQPFVPNPGQNPNGARIILVYVDSNGNSIIEAGEKQAYYYPGVGGPPTTIFSDGTVNTGDLLMLSEFGTSYRLDGVDPADTTINFAGSGITVRRLQLGDYPKLGVGHSPAAGEATHSLYGFAFQPQPRPLFGEPILQLGENAVIDYRTTPAVTTLGVNASGGSFDVLFTPSGQVYAPATQSIIALWIRDPNKTANPFDFNNAGEQVLVVVYPKTGMISTSLVYPDINNAHKYAREGINAGL